MNELDYLVGDQTPRQWLPESKLFWCHRLIEAGKITIHVKSWPLVKSEGVNSIQELIERLPENEKMYHDDELRNHVASDSRAERGIVYETLGIVAYAGVAPLDKPFAKVTWPDGEVKYYSHPDVKERVKRR